MLVRIVRSCIQYKALTKLVVEARATSAPRVGAWLGYGLVLRVGHRGHSAEGRVGVVALLRRWPVRYAATSDSFQIEKQVVCFSLLGALDAAVLRL